MFPAILVSALLAGFSVMLWRRQVQARREAFIREFVFPNGFFDKLRKHHPELALKDCQLVAQGLRQFFMGHFKSGRKFVAMPSQVADDLWHEFILYTKNYQKFCDQAFGRFLHHTPAVVMSQAEKKNQGLRRSWFYACREENINPRSPSRLPLLFALDSKLHIANGFIYVANCNGVARQGEDVYCGADIGLADCGGGGLEGIHDLGGGDSMFDGGSDSGGDGCGGGGCGGD